MAKANKIIDRLWLGDSNAALDSNFFSKNNIKAVINCTPDVPTKFSKQGVEYLRLELNDSLKDFDTERMIKFLPYAVRFLHQKRDIEGKNVLVHCHAGMQRSATIVAAYLCQYHNLDLNSAINLIVSKRPVAFHHAKHLNFADALFHYRKPKTRSKKTAAKRKA